MCDAGILDKTITVEAEDARQALTAPEDWWTIVLGSGLRWTVEQMGPEAATRVKSDNIEWVEQNGIDNVGVNVIYALARKEHQKS